MRLTFKELKDEIAKIVPKSINYKVDLEAGDIAIVTDVPKEFGGGDGLVGKIAKKIKRRIKIRPDPSIIKPDQEAKTIIESIIPEEAEITQIYFDGCFSEVIIQCQNPGEAVGRKGANVNEIRDKTGWIPIVERTPPLLSKTVHDIRGYRQANVEERRKLLKDFGLNMHRPKRPGSTWARVTALGSYREVGRACHLVTTNESRIMIDVGVNVANDLDPMPFFNAPEALPIDKLDAVILTHAHLDHAGMLPVLFKYGYRGPVFCTPPTRDLMLLLQSDYLKISGSEGKMAPYSMEDIRTCQRHVIDVAWDQTTDIAPDVKMTFSNSGHILGSSAVHLHIGDGKHNLLFSGDQKYEKSWLFDAANTRFPKVESLVLESTYGSEGDYQPSRQEANQELVDIVSRTISRGGKMIFPVFAVGRSQEVMIAIDELFRSGNVKPVPVWLDGMIEEATAIHAAHPNYLTNSLRKSLLKDDGGNPFSNEWFRPVKGRDLRERILMDSSPCIVLATSGMMNAGPVVEYFKNWAHSERNSLCFVGYQAEGTLGRRLQKGFSEVPMIINGQTEIIKVGCEMATIDGFSGHSDRRQLLEFVEQLHPKPRNIICHHGDYHKCNELGHALRERYKCRTYAPKNLETIRLL
ncbi:MAG TPA: beta-CASP ribonuclease aCPSF1 [Candidatus Poseidoniaceae archaeon]|nr:MAG TPA: beta-CASP ribonuclease aCPSF1 [Candidatus Poseidoniales archaeon]DAC60353.1 MAG TPA: beta-CASP ribonuclease aCPSF1 [Candidatus Poseidoniales archaeon]HII23158.1 beta-CASP ribonuclease aCPSF1 [Candidatus Poseidoniaceae archaeon]HII50177.1 beta-CASP ribonuclease aCPSF1 [Candidatus Poseidoniaceae archaeon]|tara:strand:+ start:5463 stop:7367 length:1905 start_codon:yes stop_codon:yes gene_type:complete